MSDATKDPLRELFGLAGKTAVITGGSAGIGRDIARLFVLAGARVAIAARNPAPLEETVAELKGLAPGAEALAVQADIVDEASVRHLFDETVSVFGGFDILINNAGNTAKYPMDEITVAQWDEALAINLRGPFLCLRHAVRHLRAAGRGGAIVNVSSVSGAHTSVYNNAHYAAAKAGLNSLTTTAAVELAADNIRVNAVLPGGVATEKVLTKRGAGGATPVKGPFTVPGRLLMGRLAAMRDIAAAVLYLASPAASYMTGQLLVLDGGFTIN